MKVRKIQREDNAAIASVIRNVLIEHNVPLVGTALSDPQVDLMFETYDKSGACYFVVEDDGKIVGGCGIDHLEGADETVCELQKMYFLKSARGKGLGKIIIENCLAFAKENNYKNCYLETMEYMKAAQKLYAKSGFEYIENRMGSTGHSSCPVFMLKKIQ